MESTYPIQWEGKPVGEVFVTRKGMFRHIQCKCTGIGKGLHLMAVSGMCRIDLGVLIVDYRHPPTKNDITMARWFLDSGCPFVVVANKMDKLKKSELEPNLVTIREDLELPESCPIIPFSAEKGNGRDELVRLILNTVEK